MNQKVEFVGGLYRTTAHVVDTLLIGLLAAGSALALFGGDLKQPEAIVTALLVVLMPLHVSYYLLTVWLWSTTPGKWLLSARIADLRSGRGPSLYQSVVRYLATFLTTLTLGLGFILAIRHPYRQAWHDRLAQTAVIGDESLRPLSEAEHKEAPSRVSAAPW